ncbi:hypothetical protein HKX48_002953 [Thoreauomyces humboldtii]|nr:hypothetical protein HKX48_002953 [Thoreauomyces humboldtii]
MIRLWCAPTNLTWLTPLIPPGPIVHPEAPHPPFAFSFAPCLETLRAVESRLTAFARQPVNPLRHRGGRYTRYTATRLNSYNLDLGFHGQKESVDISIQLPCAKLTYVRYAADLEDDKVALRDSIYVWLPDLRGGECLRREKRAKDAWDEETYTRNPEVVALALTALGLNSWEELLTLFSRAFRIEKTILKPDTAPLWRDDEELALWKAPSPGETLPDACLQVLDSFERHFIRHIQRNLLVPPFQPEPAGTIQRLGEIWPTWSQAMWNGDFGQSFQHRVTAARNESSRLALKEALTLLKPYSCLPFEEDYWPQENVPGPLGEPRNAGFLDEYNLILQAISAAKAAVRHKMAEYGLLYLPAVFDLCVKRHPVPLSIRHPILWDDCAIETKLPGFKAWWHTRAVQIIASHKLKLYAYGKQWSRFELDGSSGPVRFEFTNSTSWGSENGDSNHLTRLKVQMPTREQPAIWANVFKSGTAKRKVMVAEVVKEILRELGIVEFDWDWKRLVLFLTCIGASLCDPEDIGYPGFSYALLMKECHAAHLNSRNVSFEKRAYASRWKANFYAELVQKGRTISTVEGYRAVISATTRPPICGICVSTLGRAHLEPSDALETPSRRTDGHGGAERAPGKVLHMLQMKSRSSHLAKVVHARTRLTETELLLYSYRPKEWRPNAENNKQFVDRDYREICVQRLTAQPELDVGLTYLRLEALQCPSRSPDQPFLLLTPVKLTNPAAATIGKWVHALMQDAGIEKQYTPHSIAHAVTTAQKNGGVSESVIRQGRWLRDSSTWAKHYVLRAADASATDDVGGYEHPSSDDEDAPSDERSRL